MSLATHSLAAATVLGLALASAPAEALVVVHDSDKATLKLGFMMQPQLHLSETLYPESYDMDPTFNGVDPYIRRARLLMAGRVGENVNFFMETDNPNFGKGGDWSGNTFIQDAFVEFNLGKPLRIDVGMLLMPFSHHSFQSATSLLTMDYHGGHVKYSSGKVWRDAGIMFRGQLANDKLDYRLAITNGIESYQDYYVQTDTDTTTKPPTVTETEMAYDEAVNPMDMPRVMARVNVNIFDSEDGAGAGGFFYDGVYLKTNDKGKLVSSKKVLSIGAAVDYQANVIRNGDDLDAWMGVAADVFADIPMSDKKKSLNGQANFYMYNLGEENTNNAMGVWADLGYRIHRVQPLVSVEMWDFSEHDVGDYMGGHFGLNWWYMGHTANIKGLVGTKMVDDGNGDMTNTISFALQSQLNF